jgi:5,10-methylenetetrahydromethanopterin reductase
MRIGASIDVDRPFPAVVEQVHAYAESGLNSVWAPQVFGYDSLSLFAALGPLVPGIALGTGVVPIYSRHPQVMAQQALTVQAVSGGRLTLGIGLSHQVVIEGLWGLSFERPARYLAEYLDALCPMLAGEVVAARGDVVTAVTYAPLEIPDAPAPPVLVAALGPAMLKLAGERTGGTVTWMTGRRTIAEHIGPTIRAAASGAGRSSPSVVASLPVTVTTDAGRARERIDTVMAIYPTLPSYRAMLEREGARSAADISLVGSEDEVASAVAQLADAGVTELVASVIGNADERRATVGLLSSLARET